MNKVLLKALYLRNFRNYEEASFFFSPGINAICGPNAQGKTNLLEAIHVLMTGRSFRTAHLSDLVRFGCNDFYLEAHFVKNEIEQILKFSWDGTQRKIFLNATPLPSLSALLGVLLGVILSPEDSELIKGGPASRRQFLDLQIAKASPLYFHHLSRFLRAMKQRNSLLRRKESKTIEIWEEEMATSAAFITLERKKVIEELQNQGFPLQNLLSANIDKLSLRYKSSALHEKDTRTYFLSQFVKHRTREMELGSTLTGPHKDDIHLLLADKEARFFASEGQQRSCVAALRIAEWMRLHTQTEELPLMCIDDVGISLDKIREHLLFDALSSLGQVFVTTPKEDLPLPSTACQIFIREGKIHL